MDGDRPDEGAARKVPLVTPLERAPFPWPWGIVAVGFMALAWIGVYLVWNGVVFLFSQ